jgi:protease-4
LVTRILIWVGWAGFVVCGLLLIAQFVALAEYFDTSEGLTERFFSGDKFARAKVAIVAIEGLMMEGDGFVKRQIDRIRNDNDVKAVVVRIDSPGGAVTAADFIYHHLKRLRQERKIPLVVSMGGVAASGGYYVAMAVGDQKKSIYAEPTTTTGSIGVVIPHFDISGLLARFDVKDDSIATNPRKEMLSMTKQMTAEHRELLRAYINDSFERFKEVVMEGRPGFRQRRNALDTLATGEIFIAKQAVENQLVDEIGFIEDAIARAIELAGLAKKDVRIVRFKRPSALLELFGIARAPNPAGDLAALLELNTPKAYYLATASAVLAASRQPTP